MTTLREQKLTGQRIISGLQMLQTKAQDAGLTITRHALNNAMNAAGWELAGNVDRAAKAAKGER